MNQSFYNGVSGSKTYQFGMDTLAHNISHINTVGFKAKKTEFSTIYSQTLSESATLPSSNQIGFGSRVSATATQMDQGSLIQSDNLFDLAIGGNGWFRISVGKEQFYTRRGAFNVDASGYLSNGERGYLQGINANIFQADTAHPGHYIATLKESIPLTSNSSTNKIFLPKQVTLPANPSTKASLTANLNPTVRKDFTRVAIPESSYQTSIDPTAQTIDITGNITSSNSILDPKPGDKVTVTVTNKLGTTQTFTTTLDNNLQWQLSQKDISSLNPSNNGPLSVTANLTTYQEIPNQAHFKIPIITSSGKRGFIDLQIEQILPLKKEGSEWKVHAKVLEFYETFDPTQSYDSTKFFVDQERKKVYRKYDEKEGSLLFDTRGALVGNTLPSLSNGSTLMTLSLGTLYDPTKPNSGFDGITTFAELPTSAKSTSSDGYEEGALRGYSITQNGTIFANFSNGKSSAVATIPIYHFQNDQGLSSEGGIYFSTTPNSGKPFLFTDAKGHVIQGATLMSYTLENSNVTLTNALTEMILMQKAFDANAKSITTSDQLIQRAINMKK